MKNQNICKFIDPREKELLTASNFVYEQAAAHCGEWRTLADHVVYLVAEGEGFFRCAQKVHRLAVGTLFFSLKELPFFIEQTDRLNYYYITFSGGRAEELLHRFGITPACGVFHHYEGLLPFWQESLTRADEQTIDLLAESVLLYTFSKLKRAQKDTDKVSLILTYLEEHFKEPTLTLATAAEAVGYNAKYLSHLFKKEFGMGFSEYLRLLRLNHAILLMENGVTSVKNVALLSGFSDPLYFSKIFTRAMGVSPKNYKQKST